MKTNFIEKSNSRVLGNELKEKTQKQQQLSPKLKNTCYSGSSIWPASFALGPQIEAVTYGTDLKLG